MKKKVLFFTHWYPNNENPSKGVFIKNHALAINQIADLCVVVFDIQEGITFFESKCVMLDEDGLRTCRLTVKSKYYKFFHYAIRWQFHFLKKCFKKNNINVADYDVIHSNVLFPSGVLANRFAIKYGKVQVHSEHWSKLTRFLRKDVYRFSGKKVLRYVSKVYAVSDFLKEELKSHVDTNKIAIIPNVIDETHFQFKEKNERMEKIRFLAVASWRVPKNPFYFLEALQTLSADNKFPAFELDIVGEGPLLKRMIERNYSFKINFVGALPPDKLNDYYQNADFFLHGSDYETFSVVIVEALRTGTPVLVSNVGVASEVINDANGLICNNNATDWKEKIELACSTKYNHREISNSMADKFSLNIVAEKFKEAYDQIT